MQKKKRKQYTAAFKAKIVKEMLREEKTVGQLASEYEVLSLMLYRWRDQAVEPVCQVCSVTKPPRNLPKRKRNGRKNGKAYTLRLAA